MPATPEIHDIIESVREELVAKGYQEPTAVEYSEMPYRYRVVTVTVSYVDGTGESRRADVWLDQKDAAWAIDRVE